LNRKEHEVRQGPFINVVFCVAGDLCCFYPAFIKNRAKFITAAALCDPQPGFKILSMIQDTLVLIAPLVAYGR
jgi:hypothetical protein